MSGRNFLGQLVLFQDGTQCDQGAIVAFVMLHDDGFVEQVALF